MRLTRRPPRQCRRRWAAFPQAGEEILGQERCPGPPSARDRCPHSAPARPRQHRDCRRSRARRFRRSACRRPGRRSAPLHRKGRRRSEERNRDREAPALRETESPAETGLRLARTPPRFQAAWATPDEIRRIARGSSSRSVPCQLPNRRRHWRFPERRPRRCRRDSLTVPRSVI